MCCAASRSSTRPISRTASSLARSAAARSGPAIDAPRLGRQDIDIAAGDSSYHSTDSYVLPVDVEVQSIAADSLGARRIGDAHARPRHDRRRRIGWSHQHVDRRAIALLAELVLYSLVVSQPLFYAIGALLLLVLASTTACTL